MNKILIVLFISFSLTGFSQEKSFDLGIKTGGGLSFIYGSLAKSIRPNFSYGLANGISFVYNSPKYFFFQTELLFERKTNKGIWDYYSSYNIYRTLGYDFVNLFLMPGFKTKGKVKFLLSGGFFTGLAFNQYSYFSGSKISFNMPTSKFDFGISESIGIQIPVSNKIVFNLESRFNQSLINHLKNIPFDYSNINLMVGLAYRFTKNKK